ncbi:MAG TPA: contractile injection system protein, VgrG/Pvc8 family [Longimicrobiales bacterium]
MTQERTSPERRILIDGAEIPPELDADVLEVSVCQYAEGGDRFEIVVGALDPADQQLRWIDSVHARPGNQITVELGYAGQLDRVMVGEITALRVAYSNEQAARLHIQGFDRLHRLRRGRRTRAYVQVKDSQIAEQIAAALGLSADVTDSVIVHPYVLQNNLSDIDFLMQRAKRIRYEVVVTDRTLVFRPAANDRAEARTLEYMRDLKWFDVRLSTARQVSELAVRGWNPASKEAILGVARTGVETTLMKGTASGARIAEDAFGAAADATVDLPVESQAEADQIAQALFNDRTLELVAGVGEAVGDPTIRAGSTVDLRGLGERFSGLYYVVKAEHRVTPDLGYITRFDARRNAA